MPLRVSVPAPFLLRSPVPVKSPVNSESNPLVSIVPPPAFSVTARPLMIEAVVCSVPPSNVRGPAASPRLLSALTDTIPSSMVVPPV